MQCILHTTNTNAASDPSPEYGSSVAAPEAVYVPYADGSSSNDNCRNTRCVTHYPITTYSNDHLCHNPFVPRTYTPNRRDYCRYCNGWGWFGDTTSIFIQKSYIFYTRTRVDIGVWHTYWHEPKPTRHHTTIKWDRSAVSMRGWWEGGVYLRHNARFLLFWCIKNGVIFHLFWYWWYCFECLGQYNN